LTENKLKNTLEIHIILHSSFFILHSSFFILHSSFFILHSSFFIHMRVVVQRVTKSAVVVDGVVVGRCGRGLNILLGVKIGDTRAEAEWLANKVANLRIFEDDQGKMNRSLLEIQGEALVISQFTLYGDARKGRRPAFTDAEAPDKASQLVDFFVKVLAKAFTRRAKIHGRQDIGLKP
jgi:D-aminoacyl-tRNA deacylase